MQDLGEIRREFRPGLANLVAGLFVGLLLLIGGCIAVFLSVAAVVENHGNLPFAAQNAWSWKWVGLIGLLGLGMMLVGFFLICWTRSLVSLRVHVGANGFSVTEKKQTDVFAWDDILLVQETHVYARRPLLGGSGNPVLPAMMSRRFVVNVREGEPFEFDADTVRGHNKLAQMIKEETERRGIPWEIVEEYAWE